MIAEVSDVNAITVRLCGVKSAAPRKDHILDKSELHPDAITTSRAFQVVRDDLCANAPKDECYEKDRSVTVCRRNPVRLYGHDKRRTRHADRGYLDLRVRRHSRLCQRSYADHQRSADALRPTNGQALHLPVRPGHLSASPRGAQTGKDLPRRALTSRQGFAMLLPYDFHHLAYGTCDVDDIATASAGLFWGAGRPDIEQSKDQTDDEIRSSHHRRTRTFGLPGKLQLRVGGTSGHPVVQLRQPQYANAKRSANALRPSGRLALHVQVTPFGAALAAAPLPRIHEVRA